MNTSLHTLRHSIVASVLAMLVLPVPCQEEDKPPTPDPRVELRARMRARVADLDHLRDAGTVAETHTGLIELLKSTDGTKKLDPKYEKSVTLDTFLAAENKDRKALFELLSKDLKLSVDEVGKQNGIRNLERAKSDHYLKLADGRIVQKKSIRPEPKEKAMPVGQP